MFVPQKAVGLLQGVRGFVPVTPGVVEKVDEVVEILVVADVEVVLVVVVVVDAVATVTAQFTLLALI